MSDEQPELSHDAVQTALEELFVEPDGEVFTGLDAGAAHRHISGCPECRQTYNALAIGDRQLAKSDEVTSFERGFGEAAFSSALDELLSDEEDDETINSPEGEAADVVPLTTRLTQPGWRSAIALAAGVALVTSVWLTTGGLEVLTQDDAEFQPRSAATVDEGSRYEAPRIELFCVQRDGEDVEFTGQRDVPFGALSCPRSGEFKLSYRSRSRKLRYAGFFGVDEEGTLYWYGPTPTAARALPIERTDELVPIGESIDLSVNHETGIVRVYGLFSEEPFDQRTVEGVIERSSKRALFRGDGPSELPFAGTWTSRTFEVVEGGQQ